MVKKFLYQESFKNDLPDTGIFFLLLSCFSQCFGQCRNHFKKISHNTIVCHVKNRCIRILIDGNNTIRTRHSHRMLHRTGNAAGNIKLWRNDLTCLSDLISIRNPTRIYNGTGCGRSSSVSCFFSIISISSIRDSSVISFSSSISL